MENATLHCSYFPLVWSRCCSPSTRVLTGKQTLVIHHREAPSDIYIYVSQPSVSQLQSSSTPNSTRFYCNPGHTWFTLSTNHQHLNELNLMRLSGATPKMCVIGSTLNHHMGQTNKLMVCLKWQPFPMYCTTFDWAHTALVRWPKMTLKQLN